jgi:structural maintenance of chromosome 3 (chondroitin sulfate proteoglycan 6)
LGALPSGPLADKLGKLSQTALLNKLKAANKKLKAYSHVNKKALDQYVNFTDQRDSLLRRRDELVRAAESIQQLTISLDKKKYAYAHCSPHLAPNTLHNRPQR